MAGGIVAIVASVLWLLLWGVIALAGSVLGGDTSGWVIVIPALAAGALLFVLGVSLVRGRRPNLLGWLVVGGVLLVLLGLPVGSLLEDRDAAPVNRAVQQTLMERGKFDYVKADCSRIDDNPDGSEGWICDVEFDFNYDTCLAEVSRHQGLVSARVHGCPDVNAP